MIKALTKREKLATACAPDPSVCRPLTPSKYSSSFVFVFESRRRRRRAVAIAGIVGARGSVAFVIAIAVPDPIKRTPSAHELARVDLRVRLYIVVAAAIGSGFAIQLGIAAPAHSLPFAHFANTRPVARAQPN